MASITDIIRGSRIKKVRPMTKKEAAMEGWPEGEMAIELDSGIVLYASSDEEGNGPGTFFGVTKEGDPFALCAR